MSKWKKIKFSDIGVKLIHGGTPSTNNPAYWSGTIPWITGADFASQKVAVIRQYITKDAISCSSTNLVPEGSLTLVTRTGVGKMAVAAHAVAISQDITGVVFIDEVDAEFMRYKLSHEVARLLNLN